MKNEKAKHTPGPGDIIQAVSSEGLWNLVESASMELDWSDTPDQLREEAEQDAGQIIREAPRLKAINADLLATLEMALKAEKSLIPEITRRERIKIMTTTIAKARG